VGEGFPVPTGQAHYNLLGILGGGGGVRAKSSIEVTTCTSSNILVWFGRDAHEKGVAGLTESLISSLFAIAKGLVEYERPNSWT
jgi:hypothetical protein